jgi:hypothetical protein
MNSPDKHWQAVAIEFGAHLLSAGGHAADSDRLQYAIISKLCKQDDDQLLTCAAFRAARRLIDAGLLLMNHSELLTTALQTAMLSTSQQVSLEAAACFCSLLIHNRAPHIIELVLNQLQSLLINDSSNALEWLIMIQNRISDGSPSQWIWKPIEIDLLSTLKNASNDRMHINRLRQILSSPETDGDRPCCRIILPDWSMTLWVRHFPEIAVYILNRDQLTICINQLMDRGQIGNAFRLLDSCLGSNHISIKRILPQSDIIERALRELFTKPSGKRFWKLAVDFISRLTSIDVIDISADCLWMVGRCILEENVSYSSGSSTAALKEAALKMLFAYVEHPGRLPLPPGWLKQLMFNNLSVSRDSCDHEPFLQFAVRALLGHKLIDQESDELLMFIEHVLSGSPPLHLSDTAVTLSIDALRVISVFLSKEMPPSERLSMESLPRFATIVWKAAIMSLKGEYLSDDDNDNEHKLCAVEIIAEQQLVEIIAGFVQMSLEETLLLPRKNSRIRQLLAATNRLLDCERLGLDSDCDFSSLQQLQQRCLQQLTSSINADKIGGDAAIRVEWANLLRNPMANHARIDEDMECEENHLHLDCF